MRCGARECLPRQQNMALERARMRPVPSQSEGQMPLASRRSFQTMYFRLGADAFASSAVLRTVRCVSIAEIVALKHLNHFGKLSNNGNATFMSRERIRVQCQAPLGQVRSTAVESLSRVYSRRRSNCLQNIYDSCRRRKYSTSTLLGSLTS